MTAIRPYPRKALPTRREPTPPAATPMTPNALWLDSAAAYWQAQGCVLVWHWDAERARYMGFAVLPKPHQIIATVSVYE